MHPQLKSHISFYSNGLKIVVYDGYAKYEEAEIHRSAIMQDFRDNEKKKIIKKWP